MKAIDKIEEAKEIASINGLSPLGGKEFQAIYGLLNEALALLESKPEQTEFTKTIREKLSYGINKTPYIGNDVRNGLIDACDIIDNQAEQIKTLTEENEKLKEYLAKHFIAICPDEDCNNRTNKNNCLECANKWIKRILEEK